MTSPITSPIKVLVLNSCINAGGAGRSLQANLSVADPRLKAIVAMPAPGVLAAQLEGLADVVFVPEFVERMTRSPYTWPDRIRMPWLHLPANLFALSRCVERLVHLVESLRPDVIYCNHMLAKPVGVAVGSRTGVPVVFHSRACHDLWIDGKFYDWLGQRSCVRRIICNSEASAAAYRRHSNGKVTIIPNGTTDRLLSGCVSVSCRTSGGESGSMLCRWAPSCSFPIPAPSELKSICSR